MSSRLKKRKEYTALSYILTLFVYGLIFVALIIVGNIGSYYITNHQNQVATTDNPSTSITTNDYQARLLATRELIKQANVYIQLDYDDTSEIGSGTIVSLDDEYYYAITNYHVLERENGVATNKFVKTFDNISSNFEIIAFSEDLDLALIKFTKLNRSSIEPINTDNLNINIEDIILAIGNPYGNIGSITYGSIIRMTTIKELEIDRYVIEHDAPLFTGSSGGALVDEAGNLIGINSWEKNGLFYAIPITVINTFLENNL